MRGDVVSQCLGQAPAYPELVAFEVVAEHIPAVEVLAADIRPCLDPVRVEADIPVDPAVDWELEDS